MVPFEISTNIESNNTSEMFAKINIRAISQVTGDLDEVEMILPILETKTTEAVATSGRTDVAIDERISLGKNVFATGGIMTVRYAGTLLAGVLSGIEFLASYPYGCIEQKLAVILPEVVLKKLALSAGEDYDLHKRFTKRFISNEY